MQDVILDANQWKEKGNQLFQAKKYQEALDCYEESLKIKPDFKESLLNKGYCHKELGDEPAALTAFSKAIAIDPTYTKAVYNKATLLFSQNKVQIALEMVDKYIAQGGNDDSLLDLRKQYANTLVKTLLGEGAPLKPNKLFQEAQKYKKNDDYENARKHLRATLILSPQHEEAKILLGQLQTETTTASPMLFKPVIKTSIESTRQQKWEAKKYFYVKQGHSSTWQYNINQPKTLECGFYTEKFYNCLIIILRNKNSGKLVTLHADPSISLKDVKDMVEWAGEAAEKTIYLKRCNEAQESLDDLFERDPAFKKEFTLKYIEPIKIKGKIIMDTSVTPNPVPEFESAVVWIDHETDFGTKFHSDIVEMIDDDRVIKSHYDQYEMASFGAYTNKRGSGMTQDVQNIMALQYNSPHFQELLWGFMQAGDYGNIRSQLDTGMDVNIQVNGYTMLAYAAAEGHEKIVDLFLSRGASVDNPIKLPNGAIGGTPLFLAAGRGHINIVQKLLKEGANPHYKTQEGNTPITIALHQGHKEIAELLVNYQKSTSLHLS